MSPINHNIDDSFHCNDFTHSNEYTNHYKFVYLNSDTIYWC